jgi:hypothetical protein
MTTAKTLFERDDLSKESSVPAEGKKLARMTSATAFKTKGGTDTKWHTQQALRSKLVNEPTSRKMQSTDKVGKVPHAIKERAEAVVDKLLA